MPIHLKAYVDSYEGFGGQGTILSKFGIQEKDDLTLVISRERFSDYISPFMKDIPNIKGALIDQEKVILFGSHLVKNCLKSSMLNTNNPSIS